MLRLTGIDITVCRQCGRDRCGELSSSHRRFVRQCVCRPADPHDDPPQPTTKLPSSATRAERALLRQRSLHPDESRRCELGVIARFVRRITLRSLAASSAKRGVSWDRGSPDGRWCAPRPRSSSRSRRSTRYVPIPTARRAGAGSGPASITPDPVTACASFASTGSDAHSRSCSKPSTASKPTAFTWSASRSVSTPRRRPASSCFTSSAPSRTSSAGSSPSEPATASPRPGNAVEHRVDRRSTRRRFRPLRNSSRPDCHPAKPPNSSE